MDPAWIALIGTVSGGVGLKVVEHWLGRSKVKVDDAARIRDELRLEITQQREEIRAIEAELNQWREKYFTLLQQYMTQTADLKIALQKIKDEAVAAGLAPEEPTTLPPSTPPTP